MNLRFLWSNLTRSKKKTAVRAESTKRLLEDFSTDLNQNKRLLQEIFQNCNDVAFQELWIGPAKKRGIILYQQGLVDKKLLDETVLRPLLTKKEAWPTPPTLDFLSKSLIYVGGQKVTTEVSKVVDEILSGQTALLIEGAHQALLIDVKGWEKRSIQEPSTEVIFRGPKEGFIETIETNIAMVRKRIRDPRLKLLYYPIGRRSKTKVALAYIEGLTSPSLIREAQNRLERIDLDLILDSGYIEQMIEDKWASLFPQLQVTERPDETAAGLAEGRIAIFTDNSPGVLLAPATITSLMHSADDYYSRWLSGSFVRSFRFFAAVFSIILPGLYIALTSFHPELLPTQLTLVIASSRKGVPLPAFMEAFLLEAFIELIREAGLRLPGNLGQAVSIVGGLIIGQATVSAGLVAPLMLAVVGLTAISNFSIPNFDAAQAIRMIRFMIMILATIFGLYGVSIGVILVLVHLSLLKSFGFSYLSPWSPLEPRDLKDALIRLPWPFLRERPRFLGPQNLNRQDDERQDRFSKSGKEE